VSSVSIERVIVSLMSITLVSIETVIVSLVYFNASRTCKQESVSGAFQNMQHTLYTLQHTHGFNSMVHERH